MAETEIMQGSIVQFESEHGEIHAGTVVGRSDSHGPGWHINVVYPNIQQHTWAVPAEKVSLLTNWQHTSPSGTWMPPGDHDLDPMVGVESKWIVCRVCGRQLRPPATPAIERPRPGDIVAIWAEVQEFTEGVGLKVKLFSKTDEYDAWIITDHLDPLWLERKRTDEFRSTISEMVESLSEKLEHMPEDTRVAAEVRSLIDTGKEILAR